MVIGVDPGKRGGIAFLYEDGSVKAYPMPMDEETGFVDAKELYIMLNGNIKIEHNFPMNHTIIEDTMPIKLSGTTNADVGGKNWGIVYGVLSLYSDIKIVRPKKWIQEMFSEYELAEAKKRDEKPSVKYVQDNFPDVNLLATKRARKPHDGMTDAIALAKYYETILRVEKYGV